MMAQTSTGLPMEPHVLGNYLRALVNQFFKILPMWESGEKTVGTYIRSLQCELLGCRELVLAIHEDPLFLSLISCSRYQRRMWKPSQSIARNLVLSMEGAMRKFL